MLLRRGPQLAGIGAVPLVTGALRDRAVLETLMPAATIPRSAMWDMRSREGHDYRIFVSLPEGEPGPDGFPVLYLLDGNVTFAAAASSATLQARRPKATGVAPAVVVGIGYPVDDYLDPVGRTRDYTPALAASEFPRRPDNSDWTPTGGADVFLDFIERDLKRAVEEQFAVDRNRQALFGHSFGGLLTLHALFTRPRSFRCYIAASPSLWFARAALHEEFRAFLRDRAASAPPVDLLLTVGSQEQESANSAGLEAADETARWRNNNRMIDNARELSDLIARARPHAMTVRFKEFEEENHSSVLPVAIGRAVRFALGRNAVPP